MIIATKFDIGQRVRKTGTGDIATVDAIDIGVDRDVEVEIVYDLAHAAADNPHVGADFGGEAFESEIEAV